MSKNIMYKNIADKMKKANEDKIKIKELEQWLEVNIKNLKRQKADNLYMEGVKKGMIKSGEVILGKVRELLDE